MLNKKIKYILFTYLLLLGATVLVTLTTYKSKYYFNITAKAFQNDIIQLYYDNDGKGHTEDHAIVLNAISDQENTYSFTLDNGTYQNFRIRPFGSVSGNKILITKIDITDEKGKEVKNYPLTEVDVLGDVVLQLDNGQLIINAVENPQDSNVIIWVQQELQESNTHKISAIGKNIGWMSLAFFCFFALVFLFGKRNYLIIDFILFTCATLFFHFLIYQVPADIQVHTYSVLSVNQGYAEYPANFLYYFIISLFSGFSENIDILYLVVIFVLAFSVYLKFYITRNIFIEYFKINYLNPLSNWLLSACSVGLVFCFSIPTFSFHQLNYLGYFTGNVWHNSTVIFLFPFALLLFWRSFLFLYHQRDSKKDWLWLFILIFLNVAIKPSFIFVYIIIFPIFLFSQYFKHRNIRLFIIKALPVCFAAFLVLLSYLLIYEKTSSQDGVTIAWNYIWNLYNPTFIGRFLAFMLSFLFPLMYIILDKKFYRKKIIVYSLSYILIAFLIFLLFIETGPRMNDGNFSWQLIVCTYILFAVSLMQTLANFSLEKIKINLLLFSIFGLHVFGGVLYVIKIIHFKSFW
jgi:hypothetical protein